ncbi:RNA polymerase subunit sigma-70 [Streptacidiphilus jiangxiensis]|uniref:RNA polymerase sigma-70 factor, ECF subfamily n=1 Tax=Streptacidiphilus jiangxiensis TaxID=235985 RepID=A0A1H7SBS4_STRJI|nr:RNA polymerase subunit sigma-70 [Streptacidiphilus jiangxiensis]SEL69194.1 RNA polymerase sigma-70 factor, ECF subfamily [Streptacidiphilus jiangxiensis]
MAAPYAETTLELLRGPLTGYCYRMLGAVGEVDDAVQETLLRAHRNLHRHDAARATLSTWVHSIATNVCLDLLRGARRRALPWDLGPAATSGELGTPLPASRWVEPLADSRLPHVADPGELAVRRESVRLAFVAALQWLPPRQRAALVLRDVLAFSAAETAQILDCSAAAANSALQRARATLDEHRPVPADVADPADPEQRRLLRDYVDAFESHDVDRLIGLLADDVRSGMPPFAWWLHGPLRIGAAIEAGAEYCAEDRLLPGAVASGCLTLGQYRPDQDGVLRPFALLLFELRGNRVAEIVTYLGWGDRFAQFDLPERL